MRDVMRSLVLVALLLAAATAHAATGQERAQAAGASLIGTAAPRITLKSIDGQTIDLGALYRRHGVYLKFWATWCVPCREQMPHFERSFEHAGPDLAVIAVNAGFNDSIDDVRAYRKAIGLKMPIVIDDGRLAAALNLRVTPQHVVIGRGGRILYIGHLVDDRLEAALASATHAPAQAAPATMIARNADQERAAQQRAAGQSAMLLDGSAFALRDPAGARTTAVVFLSPWCESYLATSRPARAAACRRAREQVEQMVANPHLRWVGIASGLWADRDELKAYRDEHQIAMPLALDESGALFREFGISTVPAIVLVGADGRMLGRIVKFDDPLSPQLAAYE